MVINMLVDIASARLAGADDAAILVSTGVALVNRRGASEEEQAWIRHTFTPTWAKEAAAGWNWFAKNAHGATVGFATYEQRRYRWWWVRRWLKHADVGIFGPLGVDPTLRGRDLGCLLTRRALESIKSLGFARALIPHVGPVGFYERCCGAYIAERIKILGLF
jgi:GNAT superfamily N-acetyltransferase